MNSDVSRQIIGQAVASRLADVLQRLGGWSYDDFQPIKLTASSDLVLAVEHAELLYDTIARTVPRCYLVR